MSLDSYITLGNSGLRVSPFCLGTMTFGDDRGWGSSPSEAHSILASFLDRGGNFIDTANLYTYGHSEKIIGDYFARNGAKRQSTVISTKFFCNLRFNDPNGGGAGRKSIMTQLEHSLRRLQTEYVDVYWLHLWDKFTPIEETMRTLDDLVTSGKVRYIGLSDTPAWKLTQAQMIAQFRGWTPLIALQIEYSLLQRTVEGELIPAAKELGLGITPFAPLKGGLLSGKYTRENVATKKSDRSAFAVTPTEKEFVVLDQLKVIADELDTNVATVALAWVRSRPGISSTIIGARRMGQLDVNLAALDVILSADQIVSLDALTQPTLNFPADLLRNLSLNLAHAGATVNGEPSARLASLLPASADEVY
jgi:aryl-alcohol dehydrogenase-like predicted oxidoreductase